MKYPTKLIIVMVFLSLLSCQKDDDADILEMNQNQEMADTSSDNNKVTIGTQTLNIKSALVDDAGSTNNRYSDKHYEYVVTLSDGEYVSGDTYRNARYTITAELQSAGTDVFKFGNFDHCPGAMCAQGIENRPFVSHLFVVEDTNNDDVLDFNVDPFYDGTGDGKISFNKVQGNTYTITYDMTLTSGNRLKGSYTGTFTF